MLMSCHVDVDADVDDDVDVISVRLHCVWLVSGQSCHGIA